MVVTKNHLQATTCQSYFLPCFQVTHVDTHPQENSTIQLLLKFQPNLSNIPNFFPASLSSLLFFSDPLSTLQHYTFLPDTLQHFPLLQLLFVSTTSSPGTRVLNQALNHKCLTENLNCPYKGPSLLWAYTRCWPTSTHRSCTINGEFWCGCVGPPKASGNAFSCGKVPGTLDQERQFKKTFVYVSSTSLTRPAPSHGIHVPKFYNDWNRYS